MQNLVFFDFILERHNFLNYVTALFRGITVTNECSYEMSLKADQYYRYRFLLCLTGSI